ncbi:MAG: xanthine dehydrogenase family protein molybdopterin-binding subunit [Chloroflexota bacterium]|nr:xanthine dehydrogenase family protein molybdopterin-binding subunit [Chloroflexota bacterium]
MSTWQVERQEGEDGEVTLSVAEGTPLSPWDAGAALRIVGTPRTRLEGIEKVTGSAQYAYDVRLAGQLYAGILRSPHPHARLTRVDTSAAAALPGVHAVISLADAPDIDWYDDSKLFDPTLRFAGDEVAAVAAEDEDIVADALRLVVAEYEPLPFAIDIVAALAPGATPIHEGGNVESEKTYERGDVEAGLRAADVTFDRVLTTQTAIHHSLEPHGCTVAWEGEGVTVWESTQSIFDVRQQVAEKLGLGESQVRVIKQHMGGGFGSKQIVWKQTVIAALLAKRSGRPVQLMLDREGESLAVGNRNPTRQRLRLGATADGTLTAIDVTIHQAIGAHSAGGEGSNTAGLYQTLYACPNVRTSQTGVYTNTGPAVAFRAPGYVEAAFALETGMDDLARQLGMDPLALRLTNYTGDDQSKEMPFSQPDGLRACYEKATVAFGWGETIEQPAESHRRRGVGIAAHHWVGGAGDPPGYAWVKLNPDGRADIITGTQDIGTGTRTGLAMVAAEELGFTLDQVTFHLGDTALGPYAPVSSGSATMATIGPAIRAAAAEAKAELLAAAAAFLEEAVEHLSVRDGLIRVAGEPEDRATPVAAVTGSMSPHMIQTQGARGGNPEDVSIQTFGVQCAEVEVDTRTGEVTVLRVVAAHDCGRIINPTTVDSQVIGGVTQGIGFALTEERVVDAATGIVLNANLEEYKVPTVSDIPGIQNVHVGIPDLKANPTGSKGIGEPPLIPTAPAIANAVFDAVGVRFYDLPLSRSRVVDALAARERQGVPA